MLDGVFDATGKEAMRLKTGSADAQTAVEASSAAIAAPIENALVIEIPPSCWQILFAHANDREMTVRKPDTRGDGKLAVTDQNSTTAIVAR
jgi:hypothetical protein